MDVNGFAVPMGAMLIQSAPGRIPFSALDRYARRFGIGGDAFDLLVALIEPLDLEYLDWDRERRAEAASAA